MFSKTRVIGYRIILILILIRFLHRLIACSKLLQGQHGQKGCMAFNFIKCLEIVCKLMDEIEMKANKREGCTILVETM